MFGGQIHLYGGNIFIFVICLKQIFLGTTQFGRHCPRMHPPWLLLRSEIPSGMCTKLRTVAASNNRDHTSRSLSAYASHHVQSFTRYYRQSLHATITLLLLVRATFLCVLFFAHIPFVVNHTFNATPTELLQHYELAIDQGCTIISLFQAASRLFLWIMDASEFKIFFWIYIYIYVRTGYFPDYYLSQLVFWFSHFILEFVVSLLFLQPFNFSPVSFACKFKDWGCVMLREIDFEVKKLLIHSTAPHLWRLDAKWKKGFSIFRDFLFHGITV